MGTPHFDVEARADLDAEIVRVGDQYALPARFSATITPDESDLPICHLIISVDSGRPVCEAIQLERRAGGPGLGGALLRRLPIGEYVRRSADELGYWVLPSEGDSLAVEFDGERYPLPAERIDSGHLATRLAGMTRTPAYRAVTRAPREKGRISDDTLRRVAEIYRAASLRSEPPTKAVAEELPVARSTAGRYVQRARERGFLGKARGPIAGEA